MPEYGMYGIIVAVALLLLLGLVTLILVLRRRTADQATGSVWQLLQQQVSAAAGQQEQRLNRLQEQLTKGLQDLAKTVNDQLAQGHSLSQQAQQMINERLEAAGRTIGDVKTQLGTLNQATQNILQVGTEVRKLQDILQSPKLRGSLGEWTLENLLAEVLPRSYYELQHRFNCGQTVDALVKLAHGSVAIDAKFPLANFQAMLEAQSDSERQRLRRAFLKDVCQHIDAIAEKYIVPEEGTLEFALMYVPAENVYYEATIGAGDKETDVSAHGRRRKVIPVSPNTLYAYLMVVATGLKGLQIEKNAQVIRQQLVQLADDIGLFVTDFGMIGKHLNNAMGKHRDAAAKLNEFQLRLRQLETESEPSGTGAELSQ